MGLLQWAMTALSISLAAGALGCISTRKRATKGTATVARVVLRALFGTSLVTALVLFVLVVLGVSTPA